MLSSKANNNNIKMGYMHIIYMDKNDDDETIIKTIRLFFKAFQNPSKSS